jgi:hypothetical protein
MSLYIQYHNYDKEGLLLGNPGDDLGIHTRLSHVQNAVGGRVFLIFGIGSPRQYYLWCSFAIEKVEAFVDDEDKTAYHAFGPGWYLTPPQRLEGKEFDAFKKSCANFVGFRKVDDLPFADTLKRLADQYQSPGSPSDLQGFVEELGRLLPNDTERESLAGYFLTPEQNSPSSKNEPNPVTKPQQATDGNGPKKKVADQQPQLKALSIRQPHAEAILRGVKKIEYRSGPTRIRGRIAIYASLGRYSAEDEAGMQEDYGMNDINLDDLPRGVIVGTVELFDCDEGDWHLQNPERADKLLTPTNHPQPVWFNPF